MSPGLLFDWLLMAMLLWTAWRSLSGEDLFRCVVLYIAFGLLLALAWLRLGAPDVAMAEAAVGAGMTGVLLLDALAHIGGWRKHADRARQTQDQDHE